MSNYSETGQLALAASSLVASSGAQAHNNEPFVGFSLRVKLLLGFVVIALLPLTLIAFLDYQAAKSALTDRAYRSLYVSASQTVVRLDAFFSSSLRTIETEAQWPLLANYLRATTEARQDMVEDVLYLLDASVQRARTDISSYALLDLDGRNIVDTQAANIGLDESERDYFRAALYTGLPYASRIEFSPIDGGAYIYFSSPIIPVAGDAVGVLRVRYKATILQDLVAEYTGLLGPNSFAVLVNQDHIVLAYGLWSTRDQLSEVLFRSVFPLDEMRATELQRERRLPRKPLPMLSSNMPGLVPGLAKADTDQPYFTAWLPTASDELQAGAAASMQTQPWHIAFLQSQEELLAPVHAQRRNAIVVALVILALASAAAIVVAQWLTRPLRRLTEVARQIAGGDLDVRAAINTRDETGVLARAFNLMTDQLRETLQGLRRSEERFRGIYENALEGIYQISMEGRVASANPAMAHMLGYDSPQTLITGVTEICHQIFVDPEEGKSVLTALLDSGMVLGREVEFYRWDGQRVWVSISARAVRGANGEPQCIEGFATDISERKRAEERIRYMAQHDALTGLPTRTLFLDRVAQAIAQARRTNRQVAVLFVDLDHFKRINDSFGHQVGDRLLQTVARRLQRCLREGDSVARLGGDEFVVSLPMLESADDAALVGRKILEALVEPVVVDGHELSVSTSIGISVYPDDGEEAEALLRTADTAMYHAKEKGRDNLQFYTSVLNEAAQSRLIIATHLHHALDRDEFSLHYQPQVDLGTGRVLCAEALLRWWEPEMGSVSPGKFIRVAEETGLMVDLGEWVLRRVCEQLRSWRDEGFADLRVAVNLSPYQLRRAGFADLAAEILHDTGLPTVALEFELAEGVLMTQGAENIAVFERLAAMGIGLSVDDFGTGYSSVSHLRRFPVRALKIDRSFVGGIGQDTNDTTIVTAVIAMARSLNMKVVAEGVETDSQAVFLRQHGCHAAQGFYYGKPMPGTALGNLLREGR